MAPVMMSAMRASVMSRPGRASLRQLATETFAAESTITYRCDGGAPQVDFYEMRTVATQVGAIH
jgi:hypothetical protein